MKYVIIITFFFAVGYGDIIVDSSGLNKNINQSISEAKNYDDEQKKAREKLAKEKWKRNKSISNGSYCSSDKECYRILRQRSDHIDVKCLSYNTAEETIWIDRDTGKYVSSLTSPIAERSYSFKKIANWVCGVY